MDIAPLRRVQVEQLAMEIFQSVEDYLAVRDKSRDNVFECLNAIAIVTASVLLGTGRDIEKAHTFFDSALAMALEHQKAGA